MVNNQINLPAIFFLKMDFSPNPASNQVVISFELLKNQTGILRIYDATGQVYERISIHGQGELPLDVSKYENSIYFYTVEVENQIIQRGKLLIIK